MPGAKRRGGARVAFARPVIAPDAALLRRIGRILSSGRVTNGGPEVAALERDLSVLVQEPHLAVVSSGWAALVLALRVALHGREPRPSRAGRPAYAVLPSFTFMATLNAVEAVGLTPLFCDVEPDTWTLDPAHLARVLRAQTNVAVVVPVNVFGVPPRMEAIAECAGRAGAAVVYDDAHGLGTTSPPDRAPSHADARILSLHATKLLPACEGGVLAVRDAELLAWARRLVNHGIQPDALSGEMGYNFKLSEVHATVARHVLRRLPRYLDQRRAYARRLREAARSSDGWMEQHVPLDVGSNFQNLGFVARGDADAVDRALAAFAELGVEARRYFWPPLHRLARCAPQVGLPVTNAIGDAVVCVPLYSRMRQQELRRVEAALRAAARELRRANVRARRECAASQRAV